MRTTPICASSAPIRDNCRPPRNMRARCGVIVSHSVGGSTNTRPQTLRGMTRGVGANHETAKGMSDKNVSLRRRDTREHR